MTDTITKLRDSISGNSDIYIPKREEKTEKMSKNFNWHFYEEHLAINFPLILKWNDTHALMVVVAVAVAVTVADLTFDLVKPE